jgi:DNA polymerase-3 subunit epsilon
MKVFWFDTETSGLDPAKHGIISLAYAVEIDGQTVAEGELFSNCEGKAIEDSALKVNGFTREQIDTFPLPQKMYHDLADLFGQYVDKFDREDKFYAGGYNVAFDMAFLRQLWTDCHDNYFGSWFYFGHIDPAALIPVMRYMGMDVSPRSFKLTDVAAYLGLDITGAHDAQADIALTRKVIEILIGKLRGNA